MARQIITIPRDMVASITATCPDDPDLALELITQTATKACMETLLGMWGLHVGVILVDKFKVSAKLLEITSSGGYLMSVECDFDNGECEVPR